jgi:hypothetical protein
LKQETFKCWRACEVCEGKVIMFNPKSIAYFVASDVTCDP